jgi:hypothetical protein
VETATNVVPVITNVADRYVQYPSFQENFENWDKDSPFNFTTFTLADIWFVTDKSREGSVIVTDKNNPNNQVLALTGDVTIRNAIMPAQITAGDSYAKRQAWELTFTLPADAVEGAEIVMLNYAGKSQTVKDLGVKIADGKVYYTKVVEETVENANTDAEKVTTVLSIDMENGDQTINLGGMAAETVLVDEAAPSLEGKYVLDVMALPVDMLMNGLPVFAENIVTAMPEVIEMLLDALSEVEGLEFLADISLTEEVVVTEPEMTEISTSNEIGTEINSNELPEEAPANITIIPDDEIAPMAAPQTENVIEDM